MIIVSNVQPGESLTKHMGSKSWYKPNRADLKAPRKRLLEPHYEKLFLICQREKQPPTGRPTVDSPNKKPLVVRETVPRRHRKNPYIKISLLINELNSLKTGSAVAQLVLW
ncbi:hypothetical protein [Pseudomonas versuta]|uniref:hypothetical protein n=1 Tax=Pseudomonas versuta TaxID=1788301 RepID=UPI000A72990C|nr:hypothetical protein [Pseudomonas versuta]